MGDFSFYPPRASTMAGQVDLLYTFLLAVGFIMTALIFFFVFFFAIKYRRRPGGPPPQQIRGSLVLEVTWSTVPFLVMLIMFVWGTKLYFDSATPPPNTLDLYVTGKQWMWKVQYPGGQREINEVHVPTGVPVKVTLASEDVIHSFFVPAFRVKHDVVPGHYEIVWFQATKPGRYHLFCAEYCGSNHSEMGGWVDVMNPADYEVWLSGGERGGSMADQGAKLFTQYGCVTCHVLDAKGRCPSLRNVFGHPVQLADGRTLVADEAYVRESILNPNAKIVKGYDRDVMPVFQGQISEEGLLQLIVYVKSLSQPPEQPVPTKALPATAKGSPK
ncbi:MAG: cytochrome c oxidase subunit II [Bryobacterales bacterium]|nr:cytochrome c oxidase subunit II [Bryobacterales bacterium]